MKTILISITIGLSMLAQADSSNMNVKNLDSETLIQQAKILRISIREQLKRMGKRMNQVQVLNFSGSLSGLLSSGPLRAEGYELLKETEWYFYETMTPVDINGIENRLKELVQEYKSTKTGQFSIPSGFISDCTERAITSIKKVQTKVTNTEQKISLKESVAGFSQIMQELEIRTLSKENQSVLNELLKWGTTTVIVERFYNLIDIKLVDVNNFGSYNGGYLSINGIEYLNSYTCPALEANSILTPTVLY
jgi:hypothetical protein